MSDDLPLSEALALQVETGLLLGRNGGVEAARNVPAKGTPESAALADARGRTAAPKARRIVDAGDDAHGRSLRWRDHAKGKRQGRQVGRDLVMFCVSLGMETGRFYARGGSLARSTPPATSGQELRRGSSPTGEVSESGGGLLQLEARRVPPKDS